MPLGAQSADKVKAAGAAADVSVIDVTDPVAKDKLEGAFAGADAVVIATSGVPQVGAHHRLGTRWSAVAVACCAACDEATS